MEDKRVGRGKLAHFFHPLIDERELGELFVPAMEPAPKRTRPLVTGFPRLRDH